MADNLSIDHLPTRSTIQKRSNSQEHPTSTLKEMSEKRKSMRRTLEEIKTDHEEHLEE